jgi:lysine-N-methylase
MPAYMEQFTCIGAACEDTCCAGWRVDIDRATYKKYNKVRSDLKPSLDQYIKRNRSSKNDENYASIELDAQMACPLLNQDKLCSVQLELGERYLSNVCTTYPRVSNIVNGVLEKSATMSCPEIVRLALLNPNGIEFNETIESSDIRNAVRKKINTVDEKQIGVGKLKQCFWELRIFTIQILQLRQYKLSERLILLGMFYNKVQELIVSDNFDDVPQLIVSYTALAEQGRLSETFASIPDLPLFQMELLKQLIDTRVAKGVKSERYIDCFKAFLVGIDYAEGASTEYVSSRYQEAHARYYAPFMDKHEYILENYLVNYVYMNLFPLGNGAELFDEYMMMIIHYAMIKMHLIGMAGFYKEKFNEEHIVKLIQSFAKTIEHSNTYLNEVRELIVKNGFNTMAHMAILIKNN